MGKILFILFLFYVLKSPPETYASYIASASSAQLQTTPFTRGANIRVAILEDFLKKYDSPLVPFAVDFINIADSYNLDWRLLPAIAGVESTFGKYIPYNSFNGWGWGVYGNNVIKFSSWKDGIETVSKGLKENYIDKGATNIYDIGRIYAESPTWAYKVNYFMEKIAEFKSQNEINSLSISL